MFPSLLPLLLLAQAASTDPETSFLFRVDLGSRPGARALLEGFDVLGASCDHPLPPPGARQVRVVVHPEQLEDFHKLGLHSVLLERSRPFLEIRRERRALAPLGPDPGYYTVAEIDAELLKLEKAYPGLALRIDLTALTKAPKTHEGRSLLAMKISDQVSKDEDEPNVLIAALHHARELNTSFIAVEAARRLLSGYSSDPGIKKLVDENEIWIVPAVNPDGLNYVWTRNQWWRKNRRRNSSTSYGVDLNRNYPFEWGKCGNTSSYPGSSTYRGPSAASEPEVQTMMVLARLRRFEKYLDLHSYGREVLSTYNPCTMKSYLGSAFLTLESWFRTSLLKAMTFRTRYPSASGEAPEWHHAENGSLSYLVEVGTSFQPSIATTILEEKRVWPGIRTFLGFVPAFRGSLLSIKGPAGISGTLTPTTLGFRLGERASSRQGTGRFHLWLPPGKQGIALAAPGHLSRSQELLAGSFGSLRKRDLLMVTVHPNAVLSGPSLAPMGKPAHLLLQANDPGKRFWIAMSLGTSPGFPIPPRILPLNPDPVFILSALPLAPVYSGQLGRLDSSGKATATLIIPVHPLFVGFKLWFGGITFETGWPYEVKAFTAPHLLTLTSG